MSETGLLIAAVAIFAYALIAGRLSDWILTAPMVFLGLGWGMTEAGLFHVESAEKALHLLAEATLVIVLFSDAAAVDLVALRKRFVWPERMLLIGLPAAMALGTLAGWILLPEWPIWEVALLAAIVAPTDAALGQAVVTNPAVPDRVRRALTVESGLNDGLALPAVLFFGCIAVDGLHDNIQSSWLIFAAEQIGLAAISGAAVGWLGGQAMRAASKLRLSTEAFEGVGVLALAGLSYLASTGLGGNGFLAAFVGGVAFGAVMKGRCKFVFEFMETEGQVLVLATFLLIGAVLLPEAAARIEPVAILLILISLFAVRPAAIWLSLWRTDAAPLTKGFLGWFGPRGLATVLFALLVVGQLDALKHGDEILTISAIAVALSAVLHGVSAAPGARWYGGKIEITE